MNTYKPEFGKKRKAAIDEILGELEGREDVLEDLSGNDVIRRLLDFAIREHRAGRGPWGRGRQW